MFLTRSDYDRGVNTFSPEGRLFQVEYATESIKLGSTAVGIATAEGVVLAAEKRLASPLVVAKSVNKIVEIDKHIFVTFSGISADARILVDHARENCQNHSFTYNEPMGIEACARCIGDLALSFGESTKNKNKMSRPFGVALLVAGHTAREGPALFHTDPAGSYTRFAAKAIGAGGENAQTALEEHYAAGMSLGDAKRLALQILKDTMEEPISSANVEMAVVAKGSAALAAEEEIAGIVATLREAVESEAGRK